MKAKFTTKSMITEDGNRFKVKYSMEGENIIVKAYTPDDKIVSFNLAPGHELYTAAKAAYDEKEAKRAAYEASKPAADEKLFKGMTLKGRDFTIYMDGSIGRATVTFKRKPSAERRELVKAAGFYWSPVHGCWSRKLTNKSWTAAQALYSQLA